MVSSDSVTVIEFEDPSSQSKKQNKPKAFWLTFLALVVSSFLSALDLTAVGTALPTITQDLNGGNTYVWVGSAYTLSSTAILPLSGSLADVFGRKPVMLLSIMFFALGSALAGSAQNMNMMIAARTVQGIGGGAILNLSDIIISDLVPLAERGLYEGLLGLTWSLASGIGPPIGGVFAQKVSWRWIFYLNLPLTAIAFILVMFCLRVRTPPGSVRDKLLRVDWLGNLIIIVGTTLAVIGLTLGGVPYPWKSAQVLAPLICGICLICFFVYYESRFPKEPAIPLDIMSNRTSFSGFMSTMFHGIVSISVIYYIPVYFQVCLGASPIHSAVDVLATSLVIAPWALMCGVVVQVSGAYRPMNILGWVFTVLGFGLLSMLRSDSSKEKWVFFQFITSAGIGILYSGTIFPVLAPLPLPRTAAALAFFSFQRSFAQTWGITISSTILQNELKKNLPASFLTRFPHGVEIAYAVIPMIHQLEEPLRSQVRQAFSLSISIVWKTMVGISGLGVLTLFLMREVPMNCFTDETYGLEMESHNKDPKSEDPKI